MQFGKSSTDITTAITLTLLFRSVGAVIFGVAADRYGRKWTLVINLLLIAIFELGSSFCNTYQQFLAVRSLFGIAMGGIWVSDQCRNPFRSPTSILTCVLFHSDRVWPHQLLSKISLLTPEVSSLVSFNKATPSATSSQPSSI